MTPLVVDGKVNPYRRYWWGGVPEGWTEEARTVRSGLCLTREGFIAYFYSPSIDPDRLAAAMLRARCSYAIHLDMNAGHCGFEFYRVAAKGKLPTVERALDPTWEAKGEVSGVQGFEFQSRLMVRKMPLMDFPRYIQPSSRDFFYLTRRTLLPPPPLRPIFADEPGDGKWRAEGMPGNAWPHALAFSRLHVAAAKGRQPLLLTAIDAKQVKATETPASAVIGIALPAGDKQELGVRLTAQGFFVSSDVGEDLAALSGAGAPLAYRIRSAICVGRGGSLLTILTADTEAPSVEAWRLALQRVQCAQVALFERPLEVILPNAGGESSAIATPRGDTLWLARSPLSGAQRIFESTPIVSPKNWAFAQKKSVAYAAPQAKD
jgi:hypothetical protein